MSSQSPIGIFDSGIGGLTVLAAVKRRLPGESVLYLGDTARVPYGTKSAETVVRYSSQCAAFLVERGVKALVVACNTASAYALPELAKNFDVPVLGVVEPGCRAALEISRGGGIGVIGTAGTVASNAYGSLLKAMDPSVRVVSRACPLFVPLVEEGWTDNDVAEAAAARYLAGLSSEGIDTLILGCTHYPLLKGVIARNVGVGVRLIDSAEATAAALEALLAGKMIAAAEKAGARDHLYVTDLPARFEGIAHRFLGGEPPEVTRVDL
ncbi:MAG: glutamate racemase [Proteobacteria bacterium]|nr:glutamate racemase [Pseudomonadota bacterium]